MSRTFISAQSVWCIKMGIILLWVLSPFFVYGQMLDPVSFTVKTDTLKSGQLNTILIEAQIDDNWHLYSIYNEPNSGPIPTRFSSTDSNVIIAGDIRESDADIEYDPNFDKELGWHSEQALFVVPVLPNPELQLQVKHEVGLAVRYQVCDDRSCLPPRTKDIYGSVYLEDGGVDRAQISFTGIDHGFGSGIQRGNESANSGLSQESESGVESTSMFLFSLVAGLLAGMIIAYYRRKSKQKN